MTQALVIAKNLILKPAQIDELTVMKLLNSLRGRFIDDADLYFQSNHYESWFLEDSEVKSGSYSIDSGVGIRAVSGDKTGYAYCDDVCVTSMQRAVTAAKSIATLSTKSTKSCYILGQSTAHYQPINPIDSFSKQQKIDLLLAIDAQARAEDNRVVQVNASLTGCYEIVMIAGFVGEMVADVRPLVSIHVNVMVEDSQGRRQSARSGGGGRFSYDYFIKHHKAQAYAKAAVREAIINLDAGDAPAGTMPVVLGPGWPGVLLHEAVGHGLEGDFNRKGLSAFANLLGQQVAAAGVTVVDDGTKANRRGSLSIDDEGTPTQCTTLIDNGILVNYMQDRLNARLMKMLPTGNCRRESYAHIPMPRMTNTYMLAGKYHPDEIITTVNRGIYAVNFGGGQVDITSGQFVFSASEAYLIENGKVTRPIKGATLIGNGPEIMQKISMIGNDLALDDGIGVCGKEGQSVPVGVGQPTLKIDALTVGGTN